MNSDGFDFLVQQMGGGLTRRAGLRLMPGLGLLIGMLSAAEIAHLVVAKKRKRRKKPKKKLVSRQVCKFVARFSPWAGAAAPAHGG